MNSSTYLDRRGRIEDYFDRTAAQTWARLTSDAPVGKIRATVRAGRNRMRETLLSWLPENLDGARILDAGCGTGALALEAARRGAQVVAIDLSPTLIDLARERAASDPVSARIDFRSGDMLSAELGSFDHVVAMDSLIHYSADDALRALWTLSERTSRSMLFTYAPSTPLLSAMHAVGRLFPKSDRAPAIVPVDGRSLHRGIDAKARLIGWRRGREQRVGSGFYTSHAQELVRR